jgi:triphosphoribosyl-dephospho-CoA synthase
MKVFVEKLEEFKDVNTATVLTYHFLLSRYPDTLVIAKHGMAVAEEVVEKAKEVVETFSGDLSVFASLDRELTLRDINPGTIADITAASLFFALIEGVRV